MKKIFIFSIMCLFAVFANAQEGKWHTDSIHTWYEAPNPELDGSVFSFERNHKAAQGYFMLRVTNDMFIETSTSKKKIDDMVFIKETILVDVYIYNSNGDLIDTILGFEFNSGLFMTDNKTSSEDILKGKGMAFTKKETSFGTNNLPNMLKVLRAIFKNNQTVKFEAPLYNSGMFELIVPPCNIDY